MRELEQLEAMGYHFRLDGDSIRYALYGGQPPPGASALLQSLDREKVRTLLEAREMGLQPLDTLLVPWADRHIYLYGIKAALDAGALKDVDVIYHRDTKETEYHLWPSGVDLTPWTGKEQA